MAGLDSTNENIQGLVENGFLESYFAHRAITTSSRTVTDSVDNINFIMGLITPAKPYDFFNPAPPTAKKIADYNAAQLAANKAGFSRPTGGYPPETLRDFSFQPLKLKEAETSYLRMLKHVFGKAERC